MQAKKLTQLYLMKNGVKVVDFLSEKPILVKHIKTPNAI